MSNILIGLKRTCLGVSERGDCAKDNETGLKEGGVIKILTTVLHSRAALSLGRSNENLNYSAPFAMLALFALNTYLRHAQ